MNYEHGAGPGVDSPGQVQADKAAIAESINETMAYTANHGGQEYLKEVEDLHAEADRVTTQAATEQQPQPAPAEVAAIPSVEQARANVVAATPEAPAPASPSAEAPTGPAAPAAAQSAEQAPSVQPGNAIMNQLRLFVRDVKTAIGKGYKGHHAAPKNSHEQDPHS